MKKPQSVPVKAIFNKASNQWELGSKNSEGKKVGEWKYWWATTGHFCCHTFLDEATNTLTYTRFHPDGTWSQKGTLVNDVLEGTIHYQKSENETTELALTEPLYKYVFRVICEVENGEAIWWHYFNKENAPVDLTGLLALTMEEFAQIFPDKQVPHELSLLLTFEQRYGRGTYSAGFRLSIKGRSFIAAWSENAAFLKRLIPFASANDYGAVYACWDDGNKKAFNEMPVVVFGDKGGVHVVAKNIFELLQLLTYDKQLSVSHDKVSYKDKDKKHDHTESQYAPSYKAWVKEKFNIGPIDKPRPIIESAQDAFKASFDAWLMQYHTTITEKEAKKRFQLSDYIHTSYGDECRYLLLEGDVVAEGFFDLETLCRVVNTYGIMVDGNLTIKGVLYQEETYYDENDTLTLFVTGNLHAQSIIKGGGEFYVKGNLVLEQTIYGFYNEGSLTVEGDTEATTIFTEGQYFKFGGDIQGLLINTGKVDGLAADFDTTEPLLDELIVNDELSHSEMVICIGEGRPIIKEKYRQGL